MKKRKRTARERDLCDVKIKTTEYFPAAQDSEQGQDSASQAGGSFLGEAQGFNSSMVQTQTFGVLQPHIGAGADHPGANGQRYFTIQRVGSKDDAAGSLHQHTLEDSDRIKKNSILRELAKEDKDRKKSQVSISCFLSVQFSVTGIESTAAIERTTQTFHRGLKPPLPVEAAANCRRKRAYVMLL